MVSGVSGVRNLKRVCEEERARARDRKTAEIAYKVEYYWYY